MRKSSETEFDFLGSLKPVNVFYPPSSMVEKNPKGDNLSVAFYYSPAQAADVLKVMKEKLTPAIGFRYMQYNMGTKLSFAGFLHGTPPNQYGALYSDNKLYLKSMCQMRNLPAVEDGGALVFVTRGKTWFEASWESLMKFLHLN